MTEAGWQACENPHAMLGFLQGRASDRKFRLLACAYCLPLWSLLTDPRSREAVQVAVRFADGLASQEELTAAHIEAREASAGEQPQTRTFAAARAAVYTTRTDWAAWVVAGQVAHEASWVPNTAPRGKAGRAGRASRNETGAAQATMLRCVIGNPFRPVVLDPAWLAANDGAVLSIGQGIYEGGAFDQIPILADALEDAGCADADILSHLRGPGPHLRGCWVVDALLAMA